MKKILELTLILCTLSLTATFTAFSHPHTGGTPDGFDGVKQIYPSDGGAHFHQAYRNKPGTENDANKNNELEKNIGTYPDEPNSNTGEVEVEGDGTDNSDDGGTDNSDDGGTDNSDDGGTDNSDDGGGTDNSDDGGTDNSDDGGGTDNSDDGGGTDNSDDGGGTDNSDDDSTADAEGEGSPPISTTRDIPHSHNKPEAVVAGIHFGYIHTHHGFKHVHSLFYGATEAIEKAKNTSPAKVFKITPIAPLEAKPLDKIVNDIYIDKSLKVELADIKLLSPGDTSKNYPEYVNVISPPMTQEEEKKTTEKAKVKRVKYIPKPSEIFCGKDEKWPKQDRISIVSVTEEKHPKRLIVTFKNDSNSYVKFTDPFMRIAIVDKNDEIKVLSEIKGENTSGRPWLLKKSDDNPEAETVGIITLSWHIRKKNIDTNWGNNPNHADNVNKDGARFAMSLSYYNNKKDEDYSDWEKYEIVIMYNCISHEHFKKRKIGDTVRRDEIVASYTEMEKAPNAPSILFIRKKSIVWAELKQ